MTSSRQLPTRHDLEAVAGNPFTFTVTTTGATITSPAVTIKDGTRTTVTADPSVPTVSQASTVTTVAFSTADTTALGASAKKNYTYSLQALVNGAGPYELVAGVLTVAPVGTAGTSSTSTAALTVTVGAAALSLTVDVGSRAATDIAVTDTAGNYAGDDVESVLAEQVGKFQQRQGSRVIWFGDSLTSVSAGTSISGQSTSELILDSKGFHNWANVMLRHSLSFAGNAGKGSDTTAQMNARISEVLAVDSDIVVVLGGTNDSSATSPASTVNLQAIYTTLINDGRTVVACTIPPTSSTDAALLAHRTATNHWIRTYARATPGIILADTAQAYQDVSLSTFTALSSALHDGTHPNSYGAMRMGRILADALRPFVATTNNQLTTVGDTTNFLSNPIMTGSGSSRPSGWTGGGTATFSYVDRTDGVQGKWFQSVCTAGNTQFTQLNTSLTGALAVGAQVQAMIEFEVDATTASTTVPKFTCQCYNGSSFVGQAYDLYADGGASYGAAPYPVASGVLQTPPLTIPSGTTLVQVVFENGEGTFRFGRASLRVVT